MNPTNQSWPEGELRTRVAERVGRLVASSADPAPSRREDERSFEVLEEQLTRRLRAGRHTRSALIFAAALLAGGGSYWGLGRLAPTGDRAISYSVAGGPALQPGPVFAAAPTAPTEVAFSEGTRMQLAPRSRGRVMNLDRRGGRVALDDGNARVDVRHLPNARWVFQAGPFEVRVHGTSFALGWNPSTAHFDLHMHTGVVSVVGPISGGEMVLRAGESLSVTLEGHDAPAAPSSASKALDRPAPSDTPPPPAQPVPQEKSVRHEPPATSSATSRARSSAAWRAELAAGHAGAVVADAERMGTGRALESASSEDLAALADAARYVGNDDLARRALLAQRRRFTRSSRAAQAAFLLGRLEDESAPGAARALAWYDLYLDEAPRGAYAAEALGRKMMVLERGGRHVEAVAIAADYLRRFPRGSYAHAASVLVGAPGRDALPAGPRP
ncbi:MAG TPA: FecR domain-containing protein [Polyangia bacterium]